MAFKTKEEMFGDGGGFGPVVPYSVANPPGTSAGNRGIQFGEQLTAAIANRTHYALALNDEDLNTRLSVFETDGLDAAYRGGALATPGAGRLITKDGGAVETTSTLAAQYADDPANAHFRADALGDTTSGGGFDFRGSAASVPAYGVLSRVNCAVSGAYTTMAASEAVTLNPGGVGGDVIRFAGAVNDGTNTDIALDGLDFVELTGAGAYNGVYRVYAIGPATTDLVLRQLDGGVPSFASGTAATSLFFVANTATSALASSAGLAVSATDNEDAALAIFGRDMDGTLGTGPNYALAFYAQREDGSSPGALAYFTSTGRLKSAVTADGLSTKAREIEWAEGGLPIINVNKSEGGLNGYHEVGLLVRDEDGSTSSYAGLETRGRIIESTVFGVNSSINGTFAAPMGRVILPDSDGTPPPPTGQFHGFWAALVQPGATLVKILTGTGAGRYYRLGSVTVDAVVTNPDEITLTHLDGSALSPGELPTAGALTFAFYSCTTVGGRAAPITVDSGPVSWGSPPANVTPNTFLDVSSDTAGDPNGVTAGVVRGRLMGGRSLDLATSLPGVPLTMDVPWVVEPGGEIYTKGEVVSDDLVQGNTLRVDGTYLVTCAQTDRIANIDLRIGQSEQDAAGVPYWRFDRTNGWWECIGTNGTDAAIYFPILYTGRLMETEVQVWEDTAGQFVYAALQITTPVWGTPASAPTVIAANETVFLGSGGTPWGEIPINHSLGLGTQLDLGSNSYAIRVRATQVGARIRAIRQSIRFTSIGPGGIGG